MLRDRVVLLIFKTPSPTGNFNTISLIWAYDMSCLAQQSIDRNGCFMFHCHIKCELDSYYAPMVINLMREETRSPIDSQHWLIDANFSSWNQSDAVRIVFGFLQCFHRLTTVFRLDILNFSRCISSTLRPKYLIGIRLLSTRPNSHTIRHLWPILTSFSQPLKLDDWMKIKAAAGHRKLKMKGGQTTGRMLESNYALLQCWIEKLQ